MRKLIIISLILTSLISTASAGARIGVKAGGNWAGLITDYTQSEYVTLSGGFSGGVSFSFGKGDVFEFGPEILFIQKGIRYADDDESEKIQTNFLEMPLIFKWSFGPKTNVVRPFVLVGPYASFLLSANLKYDYDDDSGKEKEPLDNVNRVDAGLTSGIGMGVKLGPGQIVLDLRYAVGFIPIQSQDYIYAAFELNYGYSVMAGYVFEF